MVSVLGLVEPPWERLVASAFGLLFMLLMFSTARPVIPHGFGRRFLILCVSWMIPFLAAQVPGGIAVFEDPVWWLPGAVAASAPGLVGALVPGRLAGERMAGGASVTNPQVELDAVLQSPVGLSIVATLAVVRNAELGYVRDIVAMSESELSTQVAVLETAGYLKAHKTKAGKQTRTVLALTITGRTAFQTHCAALRAMAYER